MLTRASTSSRLSVIRPTLYQFTPKCSKDIVEAIAAGHFNQVRYLIELGYDVNACDEHERTALMLCAKINEERWAFGLAQTLIEKQADLNAKDRLGMTALHHACVNQRVLLVDLFLSAADFDMNEQDAYGNTALFYAVTRGNLAIAKTLVSHLTRYRFSIDLANRNGFTPLLQAAKRGYQSIVHLLLDYGANTAVRDKLFNRSYKDWLEVSAEIRMAKEQETQARKELRAMRYNDASYFQKDWRAKRIAGSAVQHREAESAVTDQPFSRTMDAQESIAVACERDLRNDSLYVFRKTPADVFHESVCRSSTSRTPLTLLSASSMSFATLSQDSARSWRYEMPSLYHDMEQRCSSAFRPTVRVDSSLLGFFSDENDPDKPPADGKKSVLKNARQSLTKTGGSKDTGRDKDRKAPRKPAVTDSPKLRK